MVVPRRQQRRPPSRLRPRRPPRRPRRSSCTGILRNRIGGRESLYSVPEIVMKRHRGRRRKSQKKLFLLSPIPFLLIWCLWPRTTSPCETKSEMPKKATLAEEAQEVTTKNIPELEAELRQLETLPRTQENLRALNMCKETLQRQRSLNELSKDKEKYQAFYNQHH